MVFFNTLGKIGVLPIIFGTVTLFAIIFWWYSILPQKNHIAEEISKAQYIHTTSGFELLPMEDEKKSLNMTESHLLKALFSIFDSHNLKITNGQYRFGDKSASDVVPETTYLIVDIPMQGTYSDFYQALTIAMQSLPVSVERMDIRREGYDKTHLTIALSLSIALEKQGREN